MYVQSAAETHVIFFVQGGIFYWHHLFLFFLLYRNAKCQEDMADTRAVLNADPTDTLRRYVTIFLFCSIISEYVHFENDHIDIIYFYVVLRLD